MVGSKCVAAGTLVLLSWICGCPFLQPTESDIVIDPRTDMLVGEDFDGETVELPLGKRLVVSLASNATTGYQWSIVQCSPWVLENSVHDYDISACPPEIAGCGGYERWLFLPKRSGTAVLAFEYRQPWMPGVAPARTFSLSVTVTGAEG